MQNANAEPIELLTPRQFAGIVHTTPATVLNWHRAGIVPARIAVGRIIRFDRTEALAALESRTKRERQQGGEP